MTSKEKDFEDKAERLAKVMFTGKDAEQNYNEIIRLMYKIIPKALALYNDPIERTVFIQRYSTARRQKSTQIILNYILCQPEFESFTESVVQKYSKKLGFTKEGIKKLGKAALLVTVLNPIIEQASEFTANLINDTINSAKDLLDDSGSSQETAQSKIEKAKVTEPSMKTDNDQH